MLLWQFAVYVSPSGRCEIQKTINRYDELDKAFFSRQVAHLSVTQKALWQLPYALKLTNQNPLYEIRYKANRCQTRALGFFDGTTFTITLICTHKQNIYDPADAFETAKTRAKWIGSRTATAIPLQVDGENFPANEE